MFKEQKMNNHNEVFYECISRPGFENFTSIVPMTRFFKCTRNPLEWGYHRCLLIALRNVAYLPPVLSLYDAIHIPGFRIIIPKKKNKSYNDIEECEEKHLLGNDLWNNLH